MSLSSGRFLEAAEACRAAAVHDDRAEWQRAAFVTWRIETTLGGMFGVDAAQLPDYRTYLRQMGISDDEPAGREQPAATGTLDRRQTRNSGDHRGD